MSEISLQARIDADLKEAMRNKDDVTKMALRAVKTALTMARTAVTEHEQSEEEMIAVIQKQAKQRRETAAEFEKLGDATRAGAELAELAVLERYLPKQLSEAAVEEIVRAVIAENSFTSAKQLGQVMAAAMPRVHGLADGKVVNAIARRLLQ